jgi:proteasome lid subunit RPN8/RPN11
VKAGASILVPRAVRRAIVDHASRERPLECCGLVIGSSTRAAFVVAMANVARSRVRYRIDDKAHIELRRVLRAVRPSLSIVGVYHSHPAGDAYPSSTDVAEALYSDWFHLIVGFKGGRPSLRAFRIRRGRVLRLALR